MLASQAAEVSAADAQGVAFLWQGLANRVALGVAPLVAAGLHGARASEEMPGARRAAARWRWYRRADGSADLSQLDEENTKTT